MRILLLIIVFFIYSCTYNLKKYSINEDNFNSYVYNLNGDWLFKKNYTKPIISSFYENEWENIKVPNNWYLEGKDFHGIGLYKKKIYIPSFLKNKKVFINFEGVDYFSEVWLNQKYIGFHEGYFKDFSFEISNKLNFNSENILIVSVNSPFEPVSDNNWSLKKRLIKGIFNHHDTRPGGAWSYKGQDKNTGGIWNNVYLKFYDKARIDNFYIENNLVENNKTANLKFNLEINNFYYKNSFKLEVKIKPYNFIGNYTDFKEIRKDFILENGLNKVSFSTDIDEPKLWWIWEIGNPNLYNIELRLSDYNGNIQDSKIINYGIRKFYRNKDNIFYLNDKKIFIRGTNYISTQWLSEMNKEKYLKDVLLMKDANINTIRVHAHIERKEFYNVCDELGILIWQDFPLQWGYEDSKDFELAALNQIKDMSNMLFNNSSVVIYSIHNEPPWDAFWMKYKYINYSSEQNKDLDYKLFNLLNEIDKTRYIHLISSTYEHPWYGWYTGTYLDYLKPTKQSIISEFGSQALPSKESIVKIFKDNIFPVSKKDWDLWDYHNFQYKETFEIAKIKKPNNIDEFISYTQDYQSSIIKTAAESYRRQKYNPVSAIFQFMFNEDWESVNWGILDYWRNPKKAYYTLKEVFQPIFPSIEIIKNENDTKINLYVINDLIDNYFNSYLEYSIYDSNNNKLINQKINIDIEKSSVKKITEIKLETKSTNNFRIDVRIFNNKNILATNTSNI